MDNSQISQASSSITFLANCYLPPSRARPILQRCANPRPKNNHSYELPALTNTRPQCQFCSKHVEPNKILHHSSVCACRYLNYVKQMRQNNQSNKPLNKRRIVKLTIKKNPGRISESKIESELRTLERRLEREMERISTRRDQIWFRKDNRKASKASKTSKASKSVNQ